MRDVLAEKEIPGYLDGVAARLLDGARSEFLRLNLDKRSICSLGEKSAFVATWTGTVKTTTLALLLRNMGYTASVHHGFLEVENKSADKSVESALQSIAESSAELSRISLPGLEQCMSEKFHRGLSRSRAVYASRARVISGGWGLGSSGFAQVAGVPPMRCGPAGRNCQAPASDRPQSEAVGAWPGEKIAELKGRLTRRGSLDSSTVAIPGNIGWLSLGSSSSSPPAPASQEHCCGLHRCQSQASG